MVVPSPAAQPSVETGGCVTSGLAHHVTDTLWFSRLPAATHNRRHPMETQYQLDRATSYQLLTIAKALDADGHGHSASELRNVANQWGTLDRCMSLGRSNNLIRDVQCEHRDTGHHFHTARMDNLEISWTA